jgi:ankyrin repeat protein
MRIHSFRNPSGAVGIIGIGIASLVVVLTIGLVFAQETVPKDERNQALLSACYYGDCKFAAFMLQESADVNAKEESNSGKTALILASYRGHSDIVKLLVRKGADVNILDAHGW